MQGEEILVDAGATYMSTKVLAVCADVQVSNALQVPPVPAVRVHPVPEIVAVGCPEILTDTVAELVAVPPGPVQVMPYWVTCVGETETPDPFAVAPPVLKPLPTQEVVLVLAQVSAVVPPCVVMVPGVAVSVTVGSDETTEKGKS